MSEPKQLSTSYSEEWSLEDEHQTKAYLSGDGVILKQYRTFSFGSVDSMISLSRDAAENLLKVLAAWLSPDFGK